MTSFYTDILIFINLIFQDFQKTLEQLFVQRTNERVLPKIKTTYFVELKRMFLDGYLNGHLRRVILMLNN